VFSLLPTGSELIASRFGVVDESLVRTRVRCVEWYSSGVSARYQSCHSPNYRPRARPLSDGRYTTFTTASLQGFMTLVNSLSMKEMNSSNDASQDHTFFRTSIEEEGELMVRLPFPQASLQLSSNSLSFSNQNGSPCRIKRRCLLNRVTLTHRVSTGKATRNKD